MKEELEERRIPSMSLPTKRCEMTSPMCSRILIMSIVSPMAQTELVRDLRHQLLLHGGEQHSQRFDGHSLHIVGGVVQQGEHS
eukprot:5960280-Ditylum_brightwellii.AAC.1